MSNDTRAGVAEQNVQELFSVDPADAVHHVHNTDPLIEDQQGRKGNGNEVVVVVTCRTYGNTFDITSYTGAAKA